MTLNARHESNESFVHECVELQKQYKIQVEKYVAHPYDTFYQLRAASVA